MANRIKIRHGSGTPTSNNLLQYELGWDTTNKKLYIKSGSGTASSDYTQISPNGLYLPLSGGGTVDGSVSFTNTITANISGYATYATYARITPTTPTSSTSYYLTFTAGTTANTNYALRGSTLVKVWIAADGASAYLTMGDSSHVGGITLYSSSGKYLNLVTSAMADSNKTITFPNTTGTVALTNNPTSIRALTLDTINTTTNGSQLRFLFSDKSNAVYALMWCSRVANRGAILRFGEYSEDSSGTLLGKREMYSLPTPAQGLTNDVSYDILTSKNAVTIAQGGTGATTAANALTNLGALPLSGGTMTGAVKLASSSGIYAEGSPMLYWLSGSTSSYQKQAAIFTTASTVNSKKVCDRIYFREYSYNSSTGAAIEYWDQYRLPTVTADKTSASTYEILTSKSAVTIAQGGTGATTAANAIKALLDGVAGGTGVVTNDTYFIRQKSSNYTTVSAYDIATYIINQVNIQDNVLDKTANYTLTAADSGKFIVVNSSSDLTITIPTNASSSIPRGAEYTIMRQGSGKVTINSSSITAVCSTTSRNLGTKRTTLLKKIATDTWYIDGEHLSSS